VQGSSASKEPNSGKSADEQQKSVDDGMRKEVVLKRKTLEEMKKQLKPFHLMDVDEKTIIDLRKSIDSITEFFESNKSSTMDQFIKDTDGLCDKLGDIMIKLNTSQRTWGRSQSAGQRDLQIRDADEGYQKLLKDCRKLIDEALVFFLVK